MTKKSQTENFMYCNLVILFGLLGLYYYLSREDSTIEGVRNMDCCGGIELGVHYKETDRKPPPYVQRCFQSTGSSDGGGTDYNWDGFPCTSSSHSNCCNGEGTCVATTKGGYCRKHTGGNFIYHKRGGASKNIYLKHSNDNIIDINDINDMKDYYYSRSESDRPQSRKMAEYERRREKNEAYMEKQLLNKSIQRQAGVDEGKLKLNDQKKNIQIVSYLTIIHMLFLVIFAIVIRGPIIDEIETFYDLLYEKYLTFAGKTLDGVAVGDTPPAT